MVVTGERTGRLLAPGERFHNQTGHSQYVLDCRGRLVRIKDESEYRAAGSSPQTAPWFAEVAGALSAYRARTMRLEKLLARMAGGGEQPADTVESFLVYPVGARLVELPDAFRWQGLAPVIFSIFPADSGGPLVVRSVEDSLLDGRSLEGLLEKGRWYGWRITSGDSSFSSSFSLLPESDLTGLSDLLLAISEAEAADPLAAVNAFGWLALKAQWLAGDFLYYEARAVIREAEQKAGIPAARLRELLVEVRRLQRYAHLLPSGD